MCFVTNSESNHILLWLGLGLSRLGLLRLRIRGNQGCGLGLWDIRVEGWVIRGSPHHYTPYDKQQHHLQLSLPSPHHITHPITHPSTDQLEKDPHHLRVVNARDEQQLPRKARKRGGPCVCVCKCVCVCVYVCL